MSCSTAAILNLYLIFLERAATVDFDIKIDSRKQWTYHIGDIHITKAVGDNSTQESVQLEDLYKMREQLHKHEQLRLQEQLKMQQDLLQKQQLWMQQQLQKKPPSRMSQEEVTTVDEWKFTQMLADEPKTTKARLKFETILSVLLPKKSTTVRRVTKSKKKRRHKKKMSYRHHKSKQTREDSLQEVSTTVKTTTENIFNTLSSHKENFNTTPVPQKIKYNVQVKMYSLHILEIGMQVFVEMKNKTNDDTIKTKLQDLADIYESKYKEFLNETYRHEIKTRLGTQKVVLDAIDVSDRILKRLVNVVVADLDNSGGLRENIGAMNDLQQEVRKSTDRQYRLLCSKLNICRSNNGFPEFLKDFLTTILRCDDKKFQNAIDALTEVAKEVDFKNVFNKKTRKQIKRMIEHVEKQRLGVLRPSLLIIRSIIANKNRPIVVKPSEMKKSRVNSTIALMEILDAFDIQLPRSDANILEWGDLRTNLHQWEKDKRNDIQDIMNVFMKHIKGALDDMPNSTQIHVAKNFARFMRQN